MAPTLAPGCPRGGERAGAAGRGLPGRDRGAAAGGADCVPGAGAPRAVVDVAARVRLRRGRGRQRGDRARQPRRVRAPARRAADAARGGGARHLRGAVRAAPRAPAAARADRRARPRAPPGRPRRRRGRRERGRPDDRLEPGGLPDGGDRAARPRRCRLVVPALLVDVRRPRRQLPRPRRGRRGGRGRRHPRHDRARLAPARPRPRAPAVRPRPGHRAVHVGPGVRPPHPRDRRGSASPDPAPHPGRGADAGGDQPQPPRALRRQPALAPAARRGGDVPAGLLAPDAELGRHRDAALPHAAAGRAQGRPAPRRRPSRARRRRRRACS